MSVASPSVVDGRPEIFPVNFVVDHGTILFRTATGSKLAAVTPSSEPVAFEVDAYDPVEGEAWSVIAKGRASEVTGIHEVFDLAELPLFPWHICAEATLRAHRTRGGDRSPLPGVGGASPASND